MPESFRSIVVGDNGTPEAQRAVEVALSLARCYRAKVLLLAVVTPLTAEQQAEGFGLDKAESTRASLQSKLEESARAAREQGLQVDVALAEGEAEAELERFVAEHAADLLVVGRRNVSRPRRWLEGSVSEDLLHRLAVSLLVVHTGKHVQSSGE